MRDGGMDKLFGVGLLRSLIDGDTLEARGYW